ncbi:hypothetical protein F383_24265 [Gossypium arboreum]|uniref:Uncharacterized protein n=1 Tax=Gossypium arboreum TaxID=29729 RepID=A0A0B0P2H8_GOSAR|nr:hypothetical protein F383_24265 [Gossypium arboreum]
MRQWVSTYYFELSDEALGAKLVCFGWILVSVRVRVMLIGVIERSGIMKSIWKYRMWNEIDTYGLCDIL